MKTDEKILRAKRYRRLAFKTFYEDTAGWVQVEKVPELMLFSKHGENERFLASNEGKNTRITALLLAEQIALNPCYPLKQNN